MSVISNMCFLSLASRILTAPGNFMQRFWPVELTVSTTSAALTLASSSEMLFLQQISLISRQHIYRHTAYIFTSIKVFLWYMVWRVSSSLTSEIVEIVYCLKHCILVFLWNKQWDKLTFWLLVYQPFGVCKASKNLDENFLLVDRLEHFIWLIENWIDLANKLYLFPQSIVFVFIQR